MHDLFQSVCVPQTPSSYWPEQGVRFHRIPKCHRRFSGFYYDLRKDSLIVFHRIIEKATPRCTIGRAAVFSTRIRVTDGQNAIEMLFFSENSRLPGEMLTGVCTHLFTAGERRVSETAGVSEMGSSILISTRYRGATQQFRVQTSKPQ